MYLKDITIRNFKTYRSAKITFTKGLNVITGPNGCGKSNILEAILFGLRERSPKVFRATSFSDIKTRGAGGEHAKETSVTITISSDDGSRILKLKRKISEKGGLVYYVNGRRSTMKDYLNSLITFEEKPIRYRYLAQGSVIKTAEMTPRERGRLIEDIVGISIYDEKKERALKLLEDADTRLQVAVAKIDEIRATLVTLFQEGLAATRKGIAEREWKRLLAALKSRELMKVEKSLRKREKELDSLLEEQGRVRGKKEELEGVREDLLAELRALDEAMEEKGGSRLLEAEREKARLSSEKGRIEWILRNEEGRVKALREEMVKLGREAEELKDLIKRSRKELTHLERERKANIKHLVKLREKEEELVKGLEEVNRRKEELLNLSSTMAGKKDEIFTKGLEKEAEKRVSKLRRETLEMELRIAEKRLKAVDENLKDMEGVVRELSEVRKRKEEEIKALKDRVKELEARRKRIEGEVKTAVKLLEKAKALLVKIKVKIEVQDKITKEVKDVKRVVDAAKAGIIPRVKGIMKDLVKAPEDKKGLLAIVAGERWNSIVVDTWETAQQTYDLAKRLNSHILLTVVSDFSPPPKAKGKGEASGENLLISFVKGVGEGITPLLEALYGRTVVVRSLSEAFEKAAEGFNAIDEKGEFYVEKGIFRTGAPAELLPFKGIKVRNLSDMEGVIKNFERMIDLRRRDIGEITSSLEGLRGEILRETGNLENMRGVETAFKRNIQSLKGLRDILKDKIKRLQKALEEALKGEEALSRELQSLLDEVSSFEGRRLEEMLQSLDREAGKINNTILEIRGEIASLESRNESLTSKVKNIEEALERVYRSEIAAKRAKMRRNRAAIKRIEASKGKKRERLEEVKEALSELDREIQEIQERISDYKVEIKKRRDEVKRVEADLRRLDRRLEALWSDIVRVKEEKANLSGEREKMRSEIEALGYPYPTLVANPSHLEELISRLRGEMEGIGRVNPLAKENYRERAGIYEKFSQRRNELEEEKKSILAFIDRIDREKERVYLDALSSINLKFKEIFREMVPEGDAELAVGDIEDIFGSGVKIMVQFPSKPMVEMASLSGGEKSIVVVAFLLALQSVEPGAIYIFDEIDAHLDAANLTRFVRVLKKSAQENQIILATLKVNLAEAAENLIGITMRRDVSRVIPLPKAVLTRSG